MPAAIDHLPGASRRRARLVAVGLALCLAGSFVAVETPAVAGRDWTPRIQATRRAQVYWERLMRAADADVRTFTRARRVALRRLKVAEQRRDAAVARRAASRRSLAQTRRTLGAARKALTLAVIETPPPPDASSAAMLLTAPVERGMEPAGVAFAWPFLAGPEGETPSAATGRATTADHAPSVLDVRRLERKARQQQKVARQARLRARKAIYSVRFAKSRVATAAAGIRSATIRRESAERSLGAWILAMERYGRMRAIKQSSVRPGVNTPFTWPVRGRVSQWYTRRHDGLDIVSYQGAPIRAAAYGVVSYVGWNPWDEHGRAFMVVVTHAGGFETLYGHLLPRRAVRVGQEVRRGEVVGYMGSTGNSTGTHLHFELRRGRTTVDPAGYF